jgi:hypothetical protein
MLKVKGKDYFASLFTKSKGHTQVFLDHFNAIKSNCITSCFTYHATQAVAVVDHDSCCMT